MEEELRMKLLQVGEEFKKTEIPLWDGLPAIELYMDQVIILLNQYLGMIQDENGDSEAITKNMINNYVKKKAVPAPVKKKYSRSHIAYLILVCLMKQVFSIAMIKNILPLPDVQDEEEIKKIYNSFVNNLYEAAAADIDKYSSYDETELENYVMKLSAEAIVLKTMAEKIKRN